MPASQKIMWRNIEGKKRKRKIKAHLKKEIGGVYNMYHPSSPNYFNRYLGCIK